MAIGSELGQLVELNQRMWLLLGRCRSSSCHIDDLFGLLASGNRLGSKQYLIESGNVPLQRLWREGLIHAGQPRTAGRLKLIYQILPLWRESTDYQAAIRNVLFTSDQSLLHEPIENARHSGQRHMQSPRQRANPSRTLRV